MRDYGAAGRSPAAAGKLQSDPPVDGFAVARRIRAMATSGAPQPVLIALSGYGEEEVHQRCLSEDFAHHFLKPVDFKELQQALRDL